jgi:hypothetical protein
MDLGLADELLVARAPPDASTRPRPVSGLGTTTRDYAVSYRGARVREGLAVRGEEVGNARPAVESWLRRNRLRR